jgi:uncharacterized membrane protein YhhN
MAFQYSKIMTITLSIIALISAIITIYAKLRENYLQQYIFKPLTMLAIILIAFWNSDTPMTFYQQMIIAGLIFSTIGDVLLIDSRRFVYGLLSFLVAHICFIVAFYSVTTTPNLPSLVFYLAYFAFFFAIFWKHLGKLKLPVIVYSLVLAAMSWFALSKTIEDHDHHTFHAFIGSIFFIASDSLLAFDKFKSQFRFAHVWILSTYFLAQFFIALSV